MTTLLKREARHVLEGGRPTVTSPRLLLLFPKTRNKSPKQVVILIFNVDELCRMKSENKLSIILRNCKRNLETRQYANVRVSSSSGSYA